jgi:CCR4-NOT complex subunit CAF16
MESKFVGCRSDRNVVEVKLLNFDLGGVQVLHDVTVNVKSGSRVLLVGANGAGKTTLLRILGGKHMHEPGTVQILQKNCYHDTTLNVERQYVNNEWGMRTVAFAGSMVAHQADIPVSGMMTALQEEFPERREMLLDLLGVNPNWRMHKVSDGQRRRVQLFLALLRPYKLLLLDEVTAVLDLVARQDFLQFLKEETENRECTVVYATHIFGGLDDWLTDIMYIEEGRLRLCKPIKEVEKFQNYVKNGSTAPLLRTVEDWLRAESAFVNRRRGEEKESKQELGLANAQTSAGGYAPGRMYNYWG